MSIVSHAATPHESLLPYFTFTDAGADWHLRCKVCRSGWALQKSSDHPGNLLHLLNHAHSHPAPITPPAPRSTAPTPPRGDNPAAVRSAGG
jgi:hypothetical protein